MIRNEFKVHMLNSAGKARADLIAGVFSHLLETLETISGPEGREMALVRTHLQEASFWAKRAMAQDPVNQIPREAQ